MLQFKEKKMKKVKEREEEEGGKGELEADGRGGRSGRDWPEEGGKEGEWEGEWKGGGIKKGFHKLWRTNPGSAEIALLTFDSRSKAHCFSSWTFWRGSHKAFVWHKDSASKYGPASGWNKTKALLSCLWSHWEGAVRQEDISFKIIPYTWIKMG